MTWYGSLSSEMNFPMDGPDGKKSSATTLLMSATCAPPSFSRCVNVRPESMTDGSTSVHPGVYASTFTDDNDRSLTRANAVVFTCTMTACTLDSAPIWAASATASGLLCRQGQLSAEPLQLLTDIGQRVT